MNQITIMGRLTRDPEVKTVGNSDLTLCNFSVAVDREYSKEKEVDFFDCVAFRGTANFIGKWFKKGKAIAIVGRMQSRKWTDKDGNKRTSWEVVVDKPYFCGSAKESQAEAPVAPAEIAPVPGGDPFATADGDLPF